MSKLLLAIVGLPGAGKTEATNYAMGKTGWPKVYFGDVTFDEMKRRSLQINEENERATREGLRAKYGMGAYAELSIPKVESFLQSSEAVLLESLYSWEEYLVVKNKYGENFKVLSILASTGTRGRRMANRPNRPLNAEEFQSRDYAQIENAHQAGPIARADYFVINEKSLEEFKKGLDEVLTEIISKKQ